MHLKIPSLEETFATCQSHLDMLKIQHNGIKDLVKTFDQMEDINQKDLAGRLIMFYCQATISAASTLKSLLREAKMTRNATCTLYLLSQEKSIESLLSSITQEFVQLQTLRKEAETLLESLDETLQAIELGDHYPNPEHLEMDPEMWILPEDPKIN